MSKHFRYRILQPAFLAVVIIAASACWGAARKSTAADRLKAEFLLNQSMKQSSTGNALLASYLLRQAHALDPDNDFINYNLGRESQSPKKALALMEPYAMAHMNDKYVVVPFIGMLLSSGDTGRGIRLMRDLTETYPEDKELRELMLQIYSASDSIDRSMETIDYIEKLGSDPESILAMRLDVLLNQENPDTVGARKLADSYLAKDPEDVERLRLHSSVYAYTGDYDTAIRQLEKAASMTADNAAIYRDMAMIQYEREDFPKVYEAMMEEINSADVEPSRLAVVIFSTMNDSIMALADTLYTRFPQDTMLQHTLMELSLRKSDIKSAIRYSRPLMKPESSLGTYMKLMEGLDDKSKAGEAIAMYDKARAAGTKVPMAENMLLELYAHVGDEARFIPLRDSVLREELPGIDNYDSLPDIDYQRAYLQLQNASNAYITEASMYYTLGDKKKMKLASENALKVTDMRNRPIVLNNYAYFIAVASDDPEELSPALEMAREAVLGNPSDTNFDTLAWVLFKLKRYPEAMKVMEQVVANLEERGIAEPEYYDHLGDIYAGAGETDKAVATWEKALAKDKDNELIKEKIALKKYIPAPYPPKR